MPHPGLLATTSEHFQGQLAGIVTVSATTLMTFRLEMTMVMGFPMGTGISWESHGNPMGIGIRLKLGNVNVKEWESTAWEREGMGV